MSEIGNRRFTLVGAGGQPVTVNPDGSINVVAVIEDQFPSLPNEELINEFNTVSAVIAASLTTISTFTVPVSKTLYLSRIEVGGNNVGTYSVYFDAVLQGRIRTWFNGDLTKVFDFTMFPNQGFQLMAGSVIEVKIIHSRPFVGDFESRLCGILRG